MKGIDSERYKKNIHHIDTLKQNIADSLNKASNNVKEDDTSCKQLEDKKVDAGYNAEENIEVREEDNRKAREEAARKTQEEGEEEIVRKEDEERKAHLEAEEIARKVEEERKA